MYAQQQPQPPSGVRQCTGCGASVELHDIALSAECSYCGAPMVDGARAATQLDRVAPFRITRQVAEDKLREFLGDQLWAPGEIKSLSFGGRGLRGVLVPHWALEGVVRSEYKAQVGIHWTRTETYTDSEGNTRTRTKRETEWFSLAGTAARQIEDHLVSASRGLSELESNALEPFDLGWAMPLDPRYLSGFEAELPTIAHTHAAETAAVELKQYEATRIVNELLPGDNNRLDSIRSQVEVKKYEAVLLPVWIGTYQYKDQTRHLLVNGQTGTCAGAVPKSKVKIAIAIIAAIAVVAAVIVYFTVIA